MAGGFPSGLTYLNSDFLYNHFSLYTYFSLKPAESHSIIHSPASVYDQLLTEYGLIGLIAFAIYYLGFFSRQWKTLTYGLPVIAILLSFFLVDYWFEQLSIVILFEFLMFLDMKEHSKSPDMHEAKITVLMPCFNAENFISDAIQSVLCQTFTDFELLIINDGSTDHTIELVKSFDDKRIIILEQENQGVAAALNYGLKYARAHYIARFDADDLCFADRLEKQYEFMSSNPGMHCGRFRSRIYRQFRELYFHSFSTGKYSRRNSALPYNICPFIHASVMYKKDPIKKIGYNINAHSFEDHLLWLQIKHLGKMYNIPEPLINVRLNPGSFTMDERKRSKSFVVSKIKR